MKWVAMMLSCVCLMGCQATPVASKRAITETEALRNNCYSLLHQVLNEEKDVSKLRFIKREDADLKALINRISAAANAGKVQLEGFAALDKTLMLDDLRLPPGELKARDALGWTKEKALLSESGDRFEVKLLLSQSEALGYAANLAKVAGENEALPERRAYLVNLSGEMKKLEGEVVARLTVKMPAQARARQ